MKIAVRLVLLVLLAALGFWLWTVLFPSAEKVIHKKMAGLAAAATFKAGDSPILRASQAADLVSYFSNDAEIVVENHTMSGRDEIREQAYAGFAALPGLKTSFLDTTVRVGADQQTAEANCTARIFVGDSKDYDVKELRFKFKKIEGKWLIIRVETVKTLS